MSIPDGVVELCDRCFEHRGFAWCKSLRSVTFGSSSSLERIGPDAFRCSRVESLSIPDGVVELCDGCFYGCESLSSVTFGPNPSLQRIGVEAFAYAGLESISIPDGVVELCYRCFEHCRSLRSVTFGDGSNLESIGERVFSDTQIEEISIPDSVIELYHHCFEGTSLRSITFGRGSRLERVEAEAYEMDVHVSAPDNVLNIIQNSDLVRYNNLKQYFSALTGMPLDSIRVLFDGHTWESDAHVIRIVRAGIQNMRASLPYWVVFEEGSQLQSIDKYTCRLVKQIYLLGRPNWPQEVWDQLPVKPIKLYPDTTPDVDATGE